MSSSHTVLSLLVLLLVCLAQAQKLEWTRMSLQPSRIRAPTDRYPTSRNVLQQNENTTASVLDGKITLQWTLLPNDTNSDLDMINITVTGKTTGFVALGFPTNPGQMLLTDAIIGWVTPDGVPHVDDYYITERIAACPGVCPDNEQGGENNIVAFSGFESNGETTFWFVRRLVTTDTQYDNPILLTGSTNIVFSLGSEDRLLYHGPDNKGAATVNFATGASQNTNVNTGNKSERRWHGALMFVAFMVLFPLGIFLAAYGKSIGVWWFRLHVFIQVIAILVAYAAFIDIVQWTSSEQKTHFDDTHQRIGLAIIILVTVTPFFGMLADMLWKADRKHRPFFPDYTHWIFGYCTVLLAWINIYLGLKKIGDTAAWVWALVSVWMGIVVLIYLIFLGVRIRKGDKMFAKEDTHATQDKQPNNNNNQVNQG